MSRAATSSTAPWLITAGAGVLAGLLYSLSPLTVWFFAVLPLLWWFASRDLSDRERRWLLIVLAVAVSLRVAALAGLFLTADPSQPYANVFGDEEFFKRRTLWLRNIGLGIPVHGADMIYAYDETGRSSYLWVLAYLQALVGPAPYGVHLFNTALYLFAVLLLYRVVRQSYGGLAALGGLVLLLFLPSLFTWSISALKEPLYILVCAIELACAVSIVRAPRWWQRVLAVVAVVLAAQALQSLRFGGLGLAAAGTVGGLALGVLLTRPRVFIASLVAVPLLLAVLLARPVVQERVMGAVSMAAFQHWGHLATPGYTYTLIEPRYFNDRLSVRAMSPPEAARYVIRACVAYFTVPLPWKIESRAMLAFLPEQILWYVLVALMPFGFAAGLKRDVYLTCLIAAHGATAVAMVALTGGNVGTLVRHRGLAMPYLAWFAALGACALAARLIRGGQAARAAAPPATVEPAWH